MTKESNNLFALFAIKFVGAFAALAAFATWSLGESFFGNKEWQKIIFIVSVSVTTLVLFFIFIKHIKSFWLSWTEKRSQRKQEEKIPKAINNGKYFHKPESCPQCGSSKLGETPESIRPVELLIKRKLPELSIGDGLKGIADRAMYLHNNPEPPPSELSPEIKIIIKGSLPSDKLDDGKSLQDAKGQVTSWQCQNCLTKIGAYSAEGLPVRIDITPLHQ